MSLEPVLIDGKWRSATAPSGSFSAENPASKEVLPQSFPISSRSDVDACLEAASAAVHALSQAKASNAERLASFLEGFAEAISKREDELVEMAHQETGLPREPRLRKVELPRTMGQLRKAAAAARERSWVNATIDTEAKLRSMYGPLGGAVIVFGPNNFPFAFNAVSGGDFASAIAAGNPVIAKAHPLHPGTSKLLAEAAAQALAEAELPSGMVQMLYAVEPELGVALMSDARVGAVGFTGSRQGGLALKRAADAAGKPIYLELGSTNPIFILQGALEERGQAIAEELAGSCVLGAGQFCTNPGMSIVPAGASGEAFAARLGECIGGTPAGTLLGQGVERGIATGIEHLKKYGAEVVAGGNALGEQRYAFANTLLRVSGDVFLKHATELQEETFGAVHLLVMASSDDQMCAIARALEGNLTGSVYSHGGSVDDARYAALAPILRVKVGRLLNDKMPTGVAVSPAMNHGGPFPASGHPGFTSVGMPASIHRFAALHSYDEVREQRLPEELKDRNPTGSMWRWIDGAWSQGDVQR